MKVHNLKLFLAATLMVFFGAGFLSPKVAALSGSDFNAANIIDNTIFTNGTSMSTLDIQAFLNAKVLNCDSNGTQPSGHGNYTRAQWGAMNGYPAPYTCLKDYSQDVPSKGADSYCSGEINTGTKSAAQIITDVSQACSINPKVLIVLLQKEQGLVTDDWPWSIQYTAATGYGCPDSAPCDVEFSGFFNQVYNAGHQYQRYAKQPQLFNFAAGRTSNIQYNPNSGCGSSAVGIQNSSTAALYNYTPYQPNAAALSNLYGSGDSCSAYGNRNFWRYFNDWFGSTKTNISSQPAAVTSGSGLINIYARANDGRLLERWFDPINGWNTVYNNVGGSTINSSPATLSLGSGHKDIFQITADGSVWHRYYFPDSVGWRNWESLGHPAGVPLVLSPSVVSKEPGKINVFAKGSDGRLWEKWFDNGRWIDGWNNINGSSINSAPAAMTLGSGHVDLFQTASDGSVWHRYYFPDSVGWRNWESLGHPAGITSFVTQPAVVTKSIGKINVFAKGSDGRLWEKWFDNGQWIDGWNNVGGSSINSGPAVVSLGNGHVDLFETTSDGSIRHRYYLPDATGWRDWEYL